MSFKLKLLSISCRAKLYRSWFWHNALFKWNPDNFYGLSALTGLRTGRGGELWDF